MLPRELRTVLQAVRDAFEKPLEDEPRRAAVERALRRLAPFAGAQYAEHALAASPASLPGVGPKRAEVMARRGLDSVQALLFHLPSRYDDRRAMQKIGSLEVGTRATFVGRVLGCGFAAWRGGRGRGGRMFEAVLGDETGSVNLKWFRGGEAISRVVVKDALLLVTGEVKRYRFSKELQHPEVEAQGAGEDALARARRSGAGVQRAGGRAPARPAPRDRLRRRRLRRSGSRLAAREAGARARAVVARRRAARDPRAGPRRGRRGAAGAAHAAPRAPDPRGALPARAGARAAARAQDASPRACRSASDGSAHARGAARAALRADRRPAPRLARAAARISRARTRCTGCSKGEVGSGKTVLAYLAAVAAAESGHQTALMAPTELLAEQHERTLTRLARGLAADPLRIERLSASTPRTHADLVRAELATGGVDLVVGTHALLEEGVAFRSLGLVVVDEQQRFGVLQRAALGGKASHEPHTLVMTATPIPRTLALTLYGDLDLSVLDELPPGRQPVRTVLFREGEGRQVTELLRETAARGEQVYVVYPLVEESEKSDLRAATESAQRIRAAFPGLRVDLVHGRLDAASRAEAMARFESGETQVLVSTTVVEVGVDVPNATLMIVEHAERFGLAQLHQLRGRIGRGSKPGTCALVARGVGEGSEARLAALLATRDGFEIAEADLRIRGPGEFLGTRQHGRLPDLRIADLARDVKLVSVAREAALETVRRDPELARASELVRAVRARWGARLALADVG